MWPGVTADGSIVWMGKGFYPGARQSALDFEIFLARPPSTGVAWAHRFRWITGIALALGLAGVAIVWRRRL